MMMRCQQWCQRVVPLVARVQAQAPVQGPVLTRMGV